MKPYTTRPLSDVLSETHWMHELPNDVRNRIHADAYMTTHQPEEIVVRKGDRVDSWLGVAEGLLKISAVYRTGKVVMFTGIPKGSWVGEGSVLKRELRRYDIVAMRPSRVIHLPGSTFRWLIDTSLDFNRVIVTRLNERLGQFISMMEIDRLTDPVARVARAIGTLYNPTLNPDLGPQLGLSQTELGELIGISRQSVAAALRQLQSEGLLRAVYGGITVLKLACLQTYQERNS